MWSYNKLVTGKKYSLCFFIGLSLRNLFQINIFATCECCVSLYFVNGRRPNDARPGIQPRDSTVQTSIVCLPPRKQKLNRAINLCYFDTMMKIMKEETGPAVMGNSEQCGQESACVRGRRSRWRKVKQFGQ